MSGRKRVTAVAIALTGMLFVAGCMDHSTVTSLPSEMTASFEKKEFAQENRCAKYSLVVFPQSVGSRPNWSESRDDAVDQGGVMASISSPEEQACIQRLLTVGNGSYEAYWINASELGHVGEWRWVGMKKNGLFWVGLSAGTAYGYANWNASEPSGSEGCVEFVNWPSDDSRDGRWNDVPCDSRDRTGYVLRIP